MSSSRRSHSRRLKRLLANVCVLILGVITLLLLVGLFLPHHYRVERSVVIRAKSDVIFPHLATLKRWPEWTVWNQSLDPTVQFTFDSPDSGVGARYSWTGKKVGKGTLKLTRADPAKGVSYDLDFEEGKYLSTGSLTLEPEGDGVKVTWVNEGELGRNPVNRYVGLMMDRMLGGDLEKGLANLRTKVEAPGGR